MKKLLTFAMILALLLSALTLPAMAEGEDGGVSDSVSKYPALTHHGTECPEEIDGAEFFDFDWWTDGMGVHSNQLVSADGLTSFEYMYLKAYEGEDKSTAFPVEDAYAEIYFEVEEAGVYDFFIEVMAHETYIPRTGLVQIDDGQKYYLSSTHNTNHEVFEYFSGMSAYLTLGEHRMTVYLAPDFDDSTVKSLFFDNFYFKLDENAEIPEFQAPPMWDENKDVVLHQSFDELRKNGDGAQGVFAPGASASWNMTAEVDTTVDKLDYWGWVALADELGSFGYQIDNGMAIYDENFAVEAEQPVIDAATAQGGSAASRMLIGVDISELVGEHSVRILYKDGDDNKVTLCEFTLNRTVAETEPPAVETTVETDPETTADTENDTVSAETVADTVTAAGAETTAETKAEGGCASAVMALPVVLGAMAAAFVLRRKD